MRQAKLFVVFSLLFLSGCLKPKKPKVELCQLDLPAQEGICGLTGQGANTKVIRRPLLELDKSTCAVPKEWEKVANYIHEMEIYVLFLEKNCQ
jgi:hypothetical protein